MQSGADFDATGTYRYRLWREWNRQARRLGFVMLNPSTADGQVNDPTIRRCIGFAHAWGYGRLDVVNLFAYRTPSPRQLVRATEPIGAANDRVLLTVAEQVDCLVLAWGNRGDWQGRDRTVIQLLAHHPNLRCLGLTQHNQPRHPLYLRRETILLPFACP